MRGVGPPRGLYIGCGMVISTVSSTGVEVNMAASPNAPMATASRSIPIAFVASAIKHDQSLCPSNKPMRKTYLAHPHYHRPLSCFDIADRGFG